MLNELCTADFDGVVNKLLTTALCVIWCSVTKRSLSASKVIFVTFNLNGELHAVSVGKLSEWTSKFWTPKFGL